MRRATPPVLSRDALLLAVLVAELLPAAHGVGVRLVQQAHERRVAVELAQELDEVERRVALGLGLGLGLGFLFITTLTQNSKLYTIYFKFIISLFIFR